MKIKILTLICLLLSFSFCSHAHANTLYQVSLLRAHPGHLSELITVVQQQKKAQDNKLIIMRHSQGDHWDLMLLAPASKDPLSRQQYSEYVDFQQDFLATSELSWSQVANLSVSTGLFHIEMFHAARGMHASLLKQRQMENDYLMATQRDPNAIFITQFGSDVDIFTLGFYPNMLAFATEPELDEAFFEKAATDAGFKSRADIGLYLRQFIVSHQDTLATQVH